MINKRIGSAAPLVLLSAFLGMTGCGSSGHMGGKSLKSNGALQDHLPDGEWTLDYLMNAPGDIEVLFPKVPVLRIESREGLVSGFSGCNRFTGKLVVEGKRLTWGEHFGLTRMMCPDMEPEQFFLASLKKARSYAISDSGKTLNLIMGDVAYMRFRKKE